LTARWSGISYNSLNLPGIWHGGDVSQWSSNCQTAVIFTSTVLPMRTAQEVNMAGRASTSFDPETVALLRETLEHAWACLRPEQQAAMQKTALAERMLKSAAEGERDRRRLRDAALMDLAI
jgi:hypothetical protein